MKVYIAGKVTGLENYKALFDAAKLEVAAMGYEPFSLIDLPHNHDKQWKSYMKECINLLMNCEAIYMLTNLEKARAPRWNFVWRRI